MTYQEIVRRRCLRVLEYVSRISGVIIQIITLFIVLERLINLNCTKLNLKNILSFIIFTIFTIFICDVEYSGIYTTIFFISIILGLVVVYKVDMPKAFLSTSIFMIVLFFADMITSFLFVNFISVYQLRTEYFIYSNLCVGAITVSITYIPKFQTISHDIIKTSQNNKNAKTIFFLILLIIAISILLYILSKNYVFNQYYILSIIVGFLFLMLAIIFLEEKYEKEKIISKYDQMLEYVTTFEEWIDNENMNIHESKNQLATLRGMVLKNKKAVNYIDNIIKERVNIDEKINGELKRLPKGGLKGLIYYKLTIANNNDVKLFIDVSSDIESKFSLLTEEENKILCRLIGIFLDNAIEASMESEKRTVFCEIYLGDNNLVIAISNTFLKNVELNQIHKNGYSTKGKNRGKGLYLATKVTNKDKIFILDNRIINDYYIQKITIKK